MSESTPIPPHIRTIKYKVTAHIHRVKIAKKLTFWSKVQWKRHDTVAETSLVKHGDGFSEFQQELVLVFSMHLDTDKNVFLEKKSDMVVIIDIDGQGKIKNGGYARFDLAEAINDQQERVDRKLQLVKNPDPDAYIEFSLEYQPLVEIHPAQMSMFQSDSNFSISTAEMEQGELPSAQKKDLELSPSRMEGRRCGVLENTVSKLESLAKSIMNKSSVRQADRGTKRIKGQDQESGDLQREIRQLRVSNQEMAERLESVEDEKRDLERMVDKKSRDIVAKSQQIASLSLRLQNSDNHEPSNQNNDIDGRDQVTQQLSRRLKQQEEEISMYKDKMATLEETLKQRQPNGHSPPTEDSSRIAQLEKNRIQLEKELADKSNKIGELFNMAYEIGGAELLDQLQSAIGLVEEK